MANNTWEMTNLQKYRKSVGRKYVLCTKKIAASIIVRYKLPSVEKGYSQVVGMELDKIFVYG